MKQRITDLLYNDPLMYYMVVCITTNSHYINFHIVPDIYLNP